LFFKVTELSKNNFPLKQSGGSLGFSIIYVFIAWAIVSLIPVAVAGADADPPFGGSYVGYAYIYNQAGGGVKTDLRLSIRRGQGEQYVLEMHMQVDKIARFSKVKLQKVFFLVIDEKVGTDAAGNAFAKGRVAIRESTAAGSIAIFLFDEKGKGAPVRTIKFLVEKLG